MKVLFEDNHILGVFKPANVPSQADPSGDLSLLEMGKAYLIEKHKKPGNAYLGLVHRLDRPVAGVMVFAKTSKAAARLSEQFREKETKKIYWALVAGKPPEKGELVHYIEQHSKNRVGAFKEPGRNRKKAELSFEVLAYHEDRALLRIEPKTGRKHQIRAQMAAMGWPIVGDRKYGCRLDFEGEGIALMAKELSFQHPTQDEIIKLESHDETFSKYLKH